MYSTCTVYTTNLASGCAEQGILLRQPIYPVYIHSSIYRSLQSRVLVQAKYSAYARESQIAWAQSSPYAKPLYTAGKPQDYYITGSTNWLAGPVMTATGLFMNGLDRTKSLTG